MTVRSFLAFTVLLAGPVSAQTTIETTSFWDGLMQIQPMGKPNTATYGQTFIAPSDNVLQSFSFFLRDIGGGADLQFQGYVAAWDPALLRLSGPLLFQSAVRSGPSTSAFAQFDFEAGGVALTPGATYVAFVSSSGLFGSIPVTTARTSWGFIPTDGTDAYPGGGFVFNNSGDVFSALSTTSWSPLGATDLAFEMEFSSVVPTVIPEPSTVLLMGTGMGLLFLGMVRKRRRA